MADYKVVDVEKLETELTEVAEEVRILADTQEKMSINKMTENVAQANDTIEVQKDIILEIKTTLEGKASGSKEEQEKTLDIVENGSYEVLPDEGKVLAFATVNVAVPLKYDEGYSEGYNSGYSEGFKASQESIILQEKTVTENGEVTADEGFTALEKVNVAVPPKEEQEKALEVTKNGSYEVKPDEGKALSKVNVEVNVASEGDIGKPYIDTSKITDFSYFCYGGARINILEITDTSNGTNFNNMFSGCTTIQKIPQIDTSNGTSFNNMFLSCYNMTEIPSLDTSAGQYFEYMFQNCDNLLHLPQLNTSNGERFTGMFFSCKALKTIPPLDTSKGQYFSNMFYECNQLETVSLTTVNWNMSTDTFKNCYSLKNITIGEGWAFSIYLHYSNNLTVESLHGMIENLADLTGQTAKTFQIGATNLAKIDEEHLTMLQSKNWNYL